MTNFFDDEPTIEKHLFFVFDGGCKGNGRENAESYGSFVETDKDKKPISKPIRLIFSKNDCEISTNNTAEILSAIRVLEHVIDHYRIVSGLSVTLYGDSMIAVNALNGNKESPTSHIQKLRFEFSKLKHQFGEVKLEWHGRINSVKVVGH